VVNASQPKQSVFFVFTSDCQLTSDSVNWQKQSKVQCQCDRNFCACINRKETKSRLFRYLRGWAGCFGFALTEGTDLCRNFFSLINKRRSQGGQCQTRLGDEAAPPSFCISVRLKRSGLMRRKNCKQTGEVD
jgi:hypothetical protein